MNRQYLLISILGAFLICFNVFASDSNKAPMYFGDFKNLVIPASADKWIRMAADDFSDCFQRATGKELKIIEGANPQDMEGNIFIGNSCSLLKFFPDAGRSKSGIDCYELFADGRNVAVSGINGQGNMYGTYEILRRFGWEFYAPGCERLPTSNNPIPIFQVSVTPVFEQRVIALNFYCYPSIYSLKDCLKLGYSPYSLKESDADMSCSVPPGIGDSDFVRIYGNYYKKIILHNMAFLCPPWLYLKEHPEYYARDSAGKSKMTATTTPNKIKLCLSNPEVFKIVEARLKEWMSQTPNARYYAIVDGDSWDWCECEGCLKMDPPQVDCFPKDRKPQQLSDRMLKFINKLADFVREKYPDKIIVAAAYQSTGQPPLTVNHLASNVRILLCPDYNIGCKCQSHTFACFRNKEFLEYFKKWQHVAGEQLEVFEYPMNYKDIYNPFFSHDGMSKRLSFYQQNGVKGVTYCGQPYLFAELFIYLQGKLMWNPDLDRNKLEDEFLSAFYGSTAPEMKKFLEKIRARVNGDNPVHQSESCAQPSLLNADLVKQGYDIFLKAEKSLPVESPYYQRVKQVKLCGLLWADLNQYITRDDEGRYSHLKELADICRNSGNPQYVTSLTSATGVSMQEWLYKKFQINIKKEKQKAWYDAPEIVELRACSTSAELNDYIKKTKEKIKTQLQSVRRGDKILLPLNGFTVYGTQTSPILNKVGNDKQMVLLLYGQESMATSFILNSIPVLDLNIEIKGLDHDKNGKVPLLVKLNGTVVFDEPNSFSKTQMSDRCLSIPVHLLKKGENKLEIENMGKPAAFENWIMFSSFCIVTK
ncbi:MAG: hypothetical protein A2020_09885 [Lentisphaerae bacterium GWF2_45_14]|nr:MAG: hypothetical protein A2020_09885 [Lentisphaerae bacterium GWF2_45_14]